MKKYSLQPTDENAIKLLQKDPIGRNANVLRFISLLSHIQESCTIAINGEWGSGKTFFARQVKLVLDALNEHSAMAPETRAMIKGLSQQVQEDTECYSTVYYDAWMYDNDDDPILSLVYATIASNQADFSEGRKRSIFGNAAALAGVLTGRDIPALLKEASGKDIFASFRDADEIQKMVKQFIDLLIEERGNRLVFFVDELDRCKPDYAIHFMERIKHYFDDDRVTFVFSVSLSQLQAVVKNYYGAEFNATRYLDKFFDLRVSLPPPDMERYMQSRLGIHRNTIPDSVCIEVVKQYGLSLRETERFARLAKICVYPAAENEERELFPDNARRFLIWYILPVMLALQMTDIRAYNEFVNGNNPEPLMDVLRWPNISLEYSPLLGHGERYDEANRLILKDNTATLISERLKAVYDAFFALHELSSGRFGNISIGMMRITDEVRGYIKNTISLLSWLSNYGDK